jgi:hypothetical protein
MSLQQRVGIRYLYPFHTEVSCRSPLISTVLDPRDEKSLHLVTQDSPEAGPELVPDTTERKDFAQMSHMPLEPSSTHMFRASEKVSHILTNTSTGHVLTRAPKALLKPTPTRDVLPIKEWKGNFF